MDDVNLNWKNIVNEVVSIHRDRPDVASQIPILYVDSRSITVGVFIIMSGRYPNVPVNEFKEFVKIVRRLRKECPWDREQTHQSIRHSLIEEAYEVVEALDENDLDALRKELGDLLLHVVMHATMAEQVGEFTLKDVVAGVSTKLIHRHPHVFGDTKAENLEQVRSNWERLKMKEGRTSVLEGVPKGMPALQTALRVQERAAKVGFDWSDLGDVWKKVDEESREFRAALDSRDEAQREGEFGDFLFALVNYARKVGINPENALRTTVSKFIRRFEFIEQETARAGKDIHASSLKEMDDLWNKAKSRNL